MFRRGMITSIISFTEKTLLFWILSAGTWLLDGQRWQPWRLGRRLLRIQFLREPIIKNLGSRAGRWQAPKLLFRDNGFKDVKSNWQFRCMVAIRLQLSAVELCMQIVKRERAVLLWSKGRSLNWLTVFRLLLFTNRGECRIKVKCPSITQNWFLFPTCQ